MDSPGKHTGWPFPALPLRALMITCAGSRLHYAKSPSGSSGIVCSAVRSFSSRAASASDKDGSSVTPGAGSSGRTGKPSPVFADRTGIGVLLLGQSLFEVTMPPIADNVALEITTGARRPRSAAAVSVSDRKMRATNLCDGLAERTNPGGTITERKAKQLARRNQPRSVLKVPIELVQDRECQKP